ncbi:MAG: hypothetical protein ACKOD1_03670 [Sphingomonadales bacterium]
MNDLLKEYLLFKKKLPLAGLGVLYLLREPARFDVGNRQFLPPHQCYEFRSGIVAPVAELVDWLSLRLGIDAADAGSRYQRFCDDAMRALNQQNTLSWKGWGVWKKDEQGIVQFQSDSSELPLAPVQANKVIRDNAEHQVRVGEDNRSSVEMSQLLQQKKVSFPIEKLVTWVWLALAVLWLSWHFYQHPFSTSSFANPTPVKVQSSLKNYQEF